MNPLTNVKNITKLNEREVELGIGQNSSWHNDYKDSAWVFVGGLNYDLTEGDIVCVFSQYGEIVNINLVRDKKTGKQKGFCFICYEDQRSTVLAVDNLNATKLIGRTIRVDHVSKYRVPKEHEDQDEITKKLQEEGCAPKEVTPPPLSPTVDGDLKPVKSETKKKAKSKKSKHRRRKSSRSSSSESRSSSSPSSSSSATDTSSSNGKRKRKSKDKSKHSSRGKDRERSRSRESRRKSKDKQRSSRSSRGSDKKRKK